MVAPTSMLNGRQGIYVQAQGLNGVKMAQFLCKDLKNTNDTANSTDGVPDWLAELNPELDAAVIIPVDLNDFKPSLVTELRMSRIVLLPGYLEMNEIVLHGEIDGERWQMSIETNVVLVLPAATGSGNISEPLDMRVTGDWRLGQELRLNAHLNRGWRPHSQRVD
jgi:hypothetical protein